MEQLLLFEDDLEQRGLFVIEEMVHPENLRRAHSRVKRNGGVPGCRWPNYLQSNTLDYLSILFRREKKAGAARVRL